MNKFLDNLKNDKKKVIFFGIIALLILILIIILIVIIMNIFKRYDYDEIKTIMVQETKDYLRAYPELVPDEENPSVTIEASTLISEEYMKDFSKLSTDQNCTGNVVVTYNNDILRYTPTLSCDRYETVTLKDTILEQMVNNLVDMDQDLTEEEINKLIANKYEIIKYKKLEAIKEIQKIFREHIDKYLSKVEKED